MRQGRYAARRGVRGAAPQFVTISPSIGVGGLEAAITTPREPPEALESRGKPAGRVAETGARAVGRVERRGAGLRSSSSRTTAASRSAGVRGAASPAGPGSRSSSSTTRPRTEASRPSPTCPSRGSSSTTTAASRTAATSGGGRRTGDYVLFLNPDAVDPRAPTSRASRRVLDAEPRVGAVAPKILHSTRRARLVAAALPAPAVDLRAGALPAPDPSRARRGRTRSSAARRPIERPTAARVGLGRVHARAPQRARGARRARRGLLHVLRGHGPLQAALGRGPRRPLRAVRGRRPRGRRVRAASFAHPGARREPRPLRRASTGAGRRRCSSGSGSRSARSRTRSSRAAAGRRARDTHARSRRLVSQPAHLAGWARNA